LPLSYACMNWDQAAARPRGHAIEPSFPWVTGR
jgi:hypothetical protein